MLIPALIFAKIPTSQNSNRVLFCLVQDQLPEFNLVSCAPSEFAQKNSLTRHDKFDWHVNKEKSICYFFEKENVQEDNLPITILTNENTYLVTWFAFPQAVKLLTNGTHRNLLQLAVQYISYGNIDESVIAADYDEEWLKKIKSQEEL